MGVISTPNINMRVLLAIAYRINFGEIKSNINNSGTNEVLLLGPAA